MTVKRPPAVRSQPVLWWELINAAEEAREQHHAGLASVWVWIHRNDYPRARAALDEALTVLEANAMTKSRRPEAREMKDIHT